MPPNYGRQCNDCMKSAPTNSNVNFSNSLDNKFLTNLTQFKDLMVLWSHNPELSNILKIWKDASIGTNRLENTRLSKCDRQFKNQQTINSQLLAIRNPVPSKSAWEIEWGGRFEWTSEYLTYRCHSNNKKIRATRISKPIRRHMKETDEGNN